MKLNKLTTAVVALAAAAVLGTSAEAQVTTLYNSGDLLLGFEQSGAANNYLVDLGSASQFLSASSPVTIQLSTVDLQADFGASWASNSATNLVNWGVVGYDPSEAVQTSSAYTAFFTQGEPSQGTLSANPGVGTLSYLKTVTAGIKNLALSSGGFNGGTSTNDTTNAINQSASAANSWSSFSPSSGTGFNLSVGVEQPLSGANNGPTDSYLDLYEDIPGGPDKEIGTFSLSSSGLLTFDPAAAAVPEPSAYALGITALILFAVLKRRNSIA